MYLTEIFDDLPVKVGEAKTAWGRSGQKVVRKYRCTMGRRKGRIVASPGQCFAAPNVKARLTLRKTKARLGKKMARKRKRTLKINPASKRIQAMNRR